MSTPRPALFRALKHRNYRLFFAGQFVSLIGTWISSIATSWLAFRLTGSELILGVVGFCGQFPTFLVAPVAGVLIDRWNRQRVMIATQFSSMLQSFALAYLTLSGQIDIPILCLLCVAQAIINAFDMPARQSFVNEMIEDKLDLPNAIALNSTMFNSGRLIGPAIGGIIIAASNEGVCFLVDGVSFFAVLISLFQIRLASGAAHVSKHNLVEGFVDGVTYVWRFVPIRELIKLVGLISLLGTPHFVLMPVFAREVLQGGPERLGLLMGASGLGAVAGSLYLASRRSIVGLGSLIVTAGFVHSLALIGFALSNRLWLSLVLIFFSGIAVIFLLASCNTLIQTLADPAKRARVMSLYTTAFMGMMPLGGLIAGALASRIGAPNTVLAGGAACIGVAVMFWKKLPEIRRQARPVYEAQGIVPPKRG
ncbi:MAG: MFS transporter [Oligoflexia bacterium]|nr:MFS transporter [Oligoflexia bacterium]